MNRQLTFTRRAAPLSFLLFFGLPAALVCAQTGANSPSPASNAPATSTPSTNTPNAAPANPAMPAEPAPSYAPSNMTPNSLGAAGGVSSAGPVSPQVPTAGSPVTFASPTVPNAYGQALPAAAPASLLPQTPGTAPLILTEDGVMILAARRNLGSLAALRDVLAARAGVRSAAVLSPPVFTIGPAFQTGGTTDGLLLEQPLELNGTRGARTQVARAQLRLAEAQALVSLQTLVYTARTNFTLLARAQEQLRLAAAVRQVTQQFDVLARKQVALGARPGIEARQTAIEAARARVAEAQAAGEEAAARALLNAYLGRAPLDPIVAVLPEQSALIAAAPDLQAAQRQALAARGEVAVAKANRDLPSAQASLARAQGRPDLAPEFRISQITPKYMDAGFGVVITVPIDYGTRRELIRQDDLSAEAGQARVLGTQAQMRAEAVQAASRLSAARLALAEYDAGIVGDARAVLDSTRVGFAAGAVTIVEVLNAERTFRQVTEERLGALAQADQAAVDFDRAVGTVPPALLMDLKNELVGRKN